MATPGQVRKIHAGAREAGVEHEQLYDLVEEASGARSISALTQSQAGAVIDVLVRLGACKRVIRKPRPTTGADGARVIEMLKQRLAHAARRRRAK